MTTLKQLNQQLFEKNKRAMKIERARETLMANRSRDQQYYQDFRKKVFKDNISWTIKKAMRNINGSIQGLWTLPTTLENAANVTTEQIKLLTSSVMSTLETLKSRTNVMSNNFNILSLLSELVIGVSNIYMAQPKYILPSILLNAGVFIAKHINVDYKVVIEHLTTILKRCSNIKTYNTRIEFDFEGLTQFLGDQKENVKLIFSLMTYAFYSIVMVKAPGKTDMESIINRAGTLGRNTQGLQMGITTIQNAIEASLKYVADICGVRDESQLCKILDGYAVWLDEVEEVTKRTDYLDLGSKTATERLLVDKNFIARIETLYQQGLEFSRTLAEMKVKPELLLAYHEHKKALEHIYRQIDTTGVFGDKPRIKPVVIWLYGESQIGKSGMTWPLAIDLNNELIVNEQQASDFSANIYFRNVEQEFWDNYKQQNICVYDDFGQSKDTEGSPNMEFFEIIRTANIAPYPLHMAHLEDKRKTKFTSKALILTSNKKELKVNSLTFPDAVLARIDLCARVYLKDEYVKDGVNGNGQTVQRLDKDKARSECGKPINTNVYWIDIVDAQSNEVLESKLEYKDFRDKAIAILNKSRDASAELTQYLTEYSKQQFKGKYNQEVIEGENQIATEEEVFYDAIGENYIPVELENCSEDVLKEVYDKCNYTAEKDLKILAVDIMGNVSRLVIECDPFLKTREVFGTLINFEIQKWKGTNKLARLYFYKYTIVQNFIYTKERIGKLLVETKDQLLTLMKEHPYSTLILGVTICMPIIMWLYRYMTRSSPLSIVNFGKSILQVNRRVPNVATLGEGIDVINHLKKNKITMVQVMLDKRASAEYIDELKTKLHLVPWFVIVILGKEEKASLDELKAIDRHINKLMDNAIKTRPLLVDRTVTVEGKYNYVDRFAEFTDIEQGVSGDSVTRRTALKSYLESFVAGSNNTVNANSNRIAKIIEQSVSGDNITQMKQRLNILEQASSGDMKTQQQQRKAIVEQTVSADNVTQKAHKPAILEGHNIEYFNDANANDLISNKILKNLYKMEISNGDHVLGNINILFVRGQCALTPLHIKYIFERGDKITIKNPFGVTFVVPRSNVQLVPMLNALGETMEACMLYFNRQIPVHSDIVSQFSTAQSMSLYNHMNTLLPTLRRQKNLLVPYIYSGLDAKARDLPLTVNDNNNQTQVVLRRGMEYGAQTTYGDCGSPLIVDNTQVANKIIGIHTVGLPGGRCLAESITQKDLLRVFEKIPDKVQIQFHDEMLPNYEPIKVELPIEKEIDIWEYFSDLVPCPNLFPIGKCSKPPFTANRTAIKPSLVNGLIEPLTTKPAHLKPILKEGKLWDIKQQMLKKAALNTVYIDDTLVDNAYNSTKQVLLSNVNPNHRRVLTDKEMIEGIEGDPYAVPVYRGTSAGYPWVLNKQTGKGKQQWLGSDEYIYTDELRQAVEYREEMARKNIRLPCVWTDTCKDERRPTAKVDAGKTRVFAAGPQDFTLLYRKYFLGFIAHVMSNRITNEQSLGTNVYGQDWAETAKYLQEVGLKVIAGDFETFDGTLNACILEKFVDLINEFYDDGEDNARIRRVLFKEVCNSIHLFPEWAIFYGWTHSQTSGSPTTTPLNSFYNSMGIRIVFQILAKHFKKKYTLRDFKRLVRIVSFGDDNVINISDEIISWFNQDTITWAYAQIGMIYTDEMKTGNKCEPFRTIGEVSYLKRHFAYDDNTHTWKAPLDLSVVMETPNWMRGDVDPIEATRQNCLVALGELVQHGRQVFDEKAPKIIRAFNSKCKDYLDASSYDEYETERMLRYYIDATGVDRESVYGYPLVDNTQNY